MSISPKQVGDIFRGLERGDGAAFFAQSPITSIGP